MRGESGRVEDIEYRRQPGGAFEDGRSRRVVLRRRGVGWALLLLILTQRLALPTPAGQLPLVLVGGLALITLGLRTQVLSLHRGRFRLFLLMAAATSLVTFVAAVRGLPLSLTSFMFLLLIYACGTVVLTEASGRDFTLFLQLFVKLMTFFAALGAGLFAAQWAGLEYRDWLGSVVPESLLLQGFHTTNPLVFGSDIFKANGVLFLEPSFFSLFSGLAVAAALYLGLGPVYLGILLLGLVSSLSGNGFVVAGAAVLTLVIQGKWTRLRPIALPGAIAALIAWVTGLGSLILSRVTEVSDDQASASLRFVQPYGLFSEQLSGSLSTVLYGRGPGAADALAVATRQSDLLAPVVPKVIYEYGVIAGVVILVLIWRQFLHRPPTWTLATGLGLVYWVVNASLLVPLIPLTMFLLLGIWEPLRGRDVRRVSAVSPNLAQNIDEALGDRRPF